MLDILGASLAKADPDIVHVELHDPREDASWVPSGH